MFLTTTIFLILFLNFFGLIFMQNKLLIIIILFILYLFIIKYKKYKHETFISVESQEKIDSILNNEILQNLLDKFVPQRKCINLKKFKSLVQSITEALSFIPKSKIFIKLFVTDKKIEEVFNKYCNKKKKICRRDIENIITSLLKKFLK